MSIQISINLFDIDEITLYRDVLTSIIEKAKEREDGDVYVLPAPPALPADDASDDSSQLTIISTTDSQGMSHCTQIKKSEKEVVGLPYETIDGDFIRCACGTTYRKIYRNKHIKTKKHCAYLASFSS